MLVSPMRCYCLVCIVSCVRAEHVCVSFGSLVGAQWCPGWSCLHSLRRHCLPRQHSLPTHTVSPYTHTLCPYTVLKMSCAGVGSMVMMCLWGNVSPQILQNNYMELASKDVENHSVGVLGFDQVKALASLGSSGAHPNHIWHSFLNKLPRRKLPSLHEFHMPSKHNALFFSGSCICCFRTRFFCCCLPPLPRQVAMLHLSQPTSVQ